MGHSNENEREKKAHTLNATFECNEILVKHNAIDG